MAGNYWFPTIFAAQLKLPQQKMPIVNVIRASYLTLGRPMFKHGNLGMDVIIKMTQYYTV